MNERLTKSIIMKETKNCPFCASIEIRCETSCGAIGPNDLGWSGAVESWNLRRPMDKVMEHINNALKVIEE
jgi:hypothetical protein